MARYLKLFTFVPLQHIDLVMRRQGEDGSQRIAQHLLAKEVVELAHGAEAAMRAEAAHREAFSQGTNTFSLSALRNTLSAFPHTKDASLGATKPKSERDERILAYKQAYAAASSAVQSTSNTTSEQPKANASDVVTLPLSMLEPGSFPRVLHAAGLVPSRSEGRRLIQKKGAYVVVPNSGSAENPSGLNWATIPEDVGTADPGHYLVDREALVLRSGKSKIQVCRVVRDEEFEAQGGGAGGGGGMSWGREGGDGKE